MNKFDTLVESVKQELQLLESINDKNKFKAVLIAGGPGSGKSFIVDKMFAGMGVNLVNSDIAFEHLLDAQNISKAIDPKNVKQFDKQMELRGHAKKLTKKKMNFWLDGMLPVIIDGTGKDFDKIKKQKKMLEDIGYDTGMVFVNTSLDVAKERNKLRARKVPEDIVTNSWKEVQENMGKFQKEFNGDFVIVDNSKSLDKDEVVKLGSQLHKSARKLILSPLKNRKGKDIIKALESSGGKYLSDLT
tara:strand:- start:454 stop:1188 length:735 start_codon:yes stop_codon:yes gene_type:complete